MTKHHNHVRGTCRLLGIPGKKLSDRATLNVRYGSRLCKNADTETNCATIESGRWRGRFIIAAKAEFATQYFVSVSKNLFPHSLGHNRKSSVGLGMSAFGGRADLIFGRLHVCL